MDTSIKGDLMTEQKPEYALTTRNTDIVDTFDDISRIGKAMAASGYFDDARDAAQAIVKILAGREMGFGPFAAMTGIDIIHGKPNIGANLQAAAVKSNPRYDYRVTQLDDTTASITFYEHGEALGVSTFTMEDARETKYYDSKSKSWKALADKHNWRNYPRNMLFARAMSNGVKWYCPDVFAGATVYAPDELSDESPPPDWDVIDGEAVERETAPEPQEPKPEPEQSTERESNGRPYDPVRLREVISKGIEDKRAKGFAFQNDGLTRYRGAMNANLEMCFAGDNHSEQKRHFVLEYLTGKASSTKLDDAEVKTIHRWLGASKDEQTGEWHPDRKS